LGFSPIDSLHWNPDIFDNDNQYQHPELGRLVDFGFGKRSN